MTAALWLVPGLPVLAALAALLPIRAARAAGPYAVLVAAGASLAIALGAAVRGEAGASAVTWLRAGDLAVGIGLRADRTGLFAAVVVAATAAAIAGYSLGYIGRRERPAFFAGLGAFTGAMLALTLADSLLLIFVAWELMGAASYLLIGFHRDDALAQRAALKAFLVTRSADAAMLAGVAVAIVGAGSADLARVFSWAGSAPAPASVVALLLLVGAAGKSAQLPFSAWLPDAMRGPTPVSALLHSATMAAAGAFLLVRLYPLLAGAGLLPVAAALGLLTALFASVAALLQSDLKRLLAYSTIAQVAEMVAAVGLAAPLAALVLLAAHAGYKASLFLLAGRLQQLAASTEMSALARANPRRSRPLAHALFVVAGLALAGVPVSLAVSARDAVLEAGLAAGPLAAAPLLALALLGGAYVGRAYRLTFGRPGHSASQPRRSVPPGAGAESPARGEATGRAMDLAPLALLAGVVLLGLASSPLAGAPLQSWLAAELPSPHLGGGLVASAASIALAIAGLALGLRGSTVRVPRRPSRAAARALSLDAPTMALAGAGRSAATALAAFDARGPDRLGRALASAGAGTVRVAGAFDRLAFDATAARVAAGSAALFLVSGSADRRRVDRAFDVAAEGLRYAGDRWRRVQTGALEHYLVGVGAWVLVVTGAAVALILASAARR